EKRARSYTGKMHGQEIVGGVTDGKASWRWRVTKKAVAAPRRAAAPHTSAARELLETRYVDLQPKANQKLADSFTGVKGNTLRELPQGQQMLGGVRFKIGESAIQLGGGFARDHPQKVEGIAIDQTFRRLQILHATAFAGPATMGAVKIHVDDGALI